MPGLHKVKTVFQWKNAAFILKTLKEPKRLLVFTEIKNRVRFMCRHNQQRSSEDATKVCVCVCVQKECFYFFVPKSTTKLLRTYLFFRKLKLRVPIHVCMLCLHKILKNTQLALGYGVWKLEGA